MLKKNAIASNSGTINSTAASKANGSYIDVDLSPQQESLLIAIAIRKLVTESVMEAHNEAQHYPAN